MNKSNSKVFHLSYGMPIIGEDIRKGDLLIMEEIKDLKMTTKQMVEFFIRLDSEGIEFESLREWWIRSVDSKGQALIKGLKSIQEASKTTLSNNSKSIKGAGAKEGSYNKDKDAAIVGMYAYTQNVSAIAAALDVSRNTVYKSIDRHNLK